MSKEEKIEALEKKVAAAWGACTACYGGWHAGVDVGDGDAETAAVWNIYEEALTELKEARDGE